MLCTGSDRLYRYFFTTVSELVSQSELWLCQTGSMAILVSWCAEPSQPRRVAWQQNICYWHAHHTTCNLRHH